MLAALPAVDGSDLSAESGAVDCEVFSINDFSVLVGCCVWGLRAMGAASQAGAGVVLVRGNVAVLRPPFVSRQAVL